MRARRKGSAKVAIHICDYALLHDQFRGTVELQFDRMVKPAEAGEAIRLVNPTDKGLRAKYRFRVAPENLRL